MTSNTPSISESARNAVVKRITLLYAFGFRKPEIRPRNTAFVLRSIALTIRKSEKMSSARSPFDEEEQKTFVFPFLAATFPASNFRTPDIPPKG